MNLFRLMTLAGVLIIIGVSASARVASAAVVAPQTQAHMSFGADGFDADISGSNVTEQKKKSDPPPRPRPKSGPKDGGEDE